MVLKELSEDKFETRLSDLMRPILSFCEDDSVYHIWEKMLEKREHISIILDEYGCLRGVVSMDDVIETRKSRAGCCGNNVESMMQAGH